MRQCVRSQFSIFAQNCNKHSRLSAYSERISIRSCSLHARATTLCCTLPFMAHQSRTQTLNHTNIGAHSINLGDTHSKSNELICFDFFRSFFFK